MAFGTETPGETRSTAIHLQGLLLCLEPSLISLQKSSGIEPTCTSITLMLRTLIYIGKSMEVGAGSIPLCGLENRRSKGYAGSSPVPSAISVYPRMSRDLYNLRRSQRGKSPCG